MGDRHGQQQAETTTFESMILRVHATLRVVAIDLRNRGDENGASLLLQRLKQLREKMPTDGPLTPPETQ